jgi:hypothetical protein
MDSTDLYKSLSELPDQAERRWQHGSPTPRVHIINSVADVSNWDTRDTEVEYYFNNLLTDLDSLFTMPIGGDFITASYNGEEWVYRISESSPAINGVKYDEDGGVIIPPVNKTNFLFELLRGGITYTFVARLVNHREGFWAKITSVIGDGFYAFDEVERDEGLWEANEDGVSDTAVEKDNSTGVSVDDIVYVAKAITDIGWEYVFSNAGGGGGEADFWARITYADSSTLSYILQRVHRVHNGGHPAWEDVGEEVYGQHQNNLRGIPVGTVVHVYKQVEWEESSNQVNSTGIWHIFELIHGDVEGSLQDLTGTPDDSEWKLSLPLTDPFPPPSVPSPLVSDGAKFYLCRVHEGMVYQREIKIDVSGHIHFIGEETEEPVAGTGGYDPWELYVVDSGEEGSPEYSVAFPPGSVFVQWANGEEEVEYTHTGLQPMVLTDDTSYSIQAKLTMDGGGSYVTDIELVLVEGTDAVDDVIDTNVIVERHVVISTFDVNGTGVIENWANLYKGRAIGLVPVMVNGMFSVGVL